MATVTCILSGVGSGGVGSWIEAPASCRFGEGRRDRQLKAPMECARDSGVGNVCAPYAESDDVLEMLESEPLEINFPGFALKRPLTFSFRKVAEMGYDAHRFTVNI